LSVNVPYLELTVEKTAL